MSEKFNDYRMMYGYLYDEWDMKKTQSEIDRYSKELKRIEPTFRRYCNNMETLRQNISIFEKIKKDMYFKELEKNFVLKKEHLLIIKSLNYTGEYFVSDFKRPFGNSNELGDYLELINIDINDLSENEQNNKWEEYKKLLDELPLAVVELSNRMLDSFC
jgi:hypothetical protein